MSGPTGQRQRALSRPISRSRLFPHRGHARPRRSHSSGADPSFAPLKPASRARLRSDGAHTSLKCTASFAHTTRSAPHRTAHRLAARFSRERTAQPRRSGRGRSESSAARRPAGSRGGWRRRRRNAARRFSAPDCLIRRFRACSELVGPRRRAADSAGGWSIRAAAREAGILFLSPAPAGRSHSRGGSMARAERSSALAAARLVAWDAGRIFLREVWTSCSGTTMQFVPLVSVAENR
jgi:hypothetical protein